MPSFEYIESALIFNLDTKSNLRSFKHSGKDFAKHKDAYSFVVSHFDEYGEFPSPEVLSENFPTLDKTAQSVNFDYAIEIFKNNYPIYKSHSYRFFLQLVNSSKFSSSLELGSSELTSSDLTAICFSAAFLICTLSFFFSILDTLK